MGKSVTIYTPSGQLEFEEGKNGVTKIIPRYSGTSVLMIIHGQETIFNNVTFSVRNGFDGLRLI